MPSGKNPKIIELVPSRADTNEAVAPHQTCSWLAGQHEVCGVSRGDSKSWEATHL